ncbi:MAG: membrane-bound lytic murein transglycosylase MltC [Candidatus Arsenophonus melophagi]|nr:membrane-bound lytic murein transglycosylase MltC [Candidatus Arsenophonus melophagi]
MKKLLLHVITIPLLVACSSNKKVSFSPKSTKDNNTSSMLAQQCSYNIENIWGMEEMLIPGPQDYVKYTNQYKTRSHINFNSGYITIETVANLATKEKLKQAIITTLLMSDTVGTVDLYSDIKNSSFSKEPFLYGQVFDHGNQPIRWKWQAQKFADYLVANKLQQRQSGLHVIWSITIQLAPNQLDKRAYKYLPYIRLAAEKYGVDESLILAIIQIESSFNPYAVSRSDALGLMQIMQKTAGRDVFRAQGKSGIPSRNYLLDPIKNIDLGTAFLSLLNNTYLGEITNITSRRYAIIAAYNAGAGSVLRVFHHDKKLAAKIINQMSPGDVYQTLVSKHPAAQSRNYLIKVNNAQKIIVNNFSI